MKLIPKTWLISLLILIAAMVGMSVQSFRLAESHNQKDLLKTAQTIHDLLMTVRYTYHQRFIASELPITEKTLELLPAHAMSAISRDFDRYHKLGIHFRNVSDLARNPDNQADTDELAAMEWFRAHPGEEEHFMTTGNGDQARFRYMTPIRIEEYCLKCHGDRSKAPATIATQYAKGYDYKLGELRGILSITIPAAAGAASVRNTLLREAAIQFGSFVLALLIGGVLIYTLILRRLKHIHAGIESFAKGNYDTRLEDAGKDEISQLAARFNEVADVIKRRTDKLRNSEALFHTMSDWTSDWEYWVDPQGKFIYISPSVKAVTGYSAADFERQPDLVDRIVHPDDHPLWASHVTAHLQDNAHANAIGLDFRIIRNDGSVCWVNHRCRPVLGEHGEYLGRRVSMQDISARKAAEAELSLYRDHLEELVAQQTEELRNAKEVAERLARTKSDFLANMSHEIRTPLNGVLGLAQIGYHDSIGRDKTQETFARILNSGKLLLTILNDILDFSKIEAGKLGIEIIPIDPRRLADDVIGVVRENATAKRLQLTAEIAPDLPSACLGDPVRISQVLLNLLSNAIKFTAHGRVCLRIGTQNGNLEFVVTDTGIGITAADMQRLFKPFEQADNSTSRRFGGTGLGLAISHRLAELMGGQLSARSEVGRGSMFMLQLPLQVTDRPVLAPMMRIQAGQRLTGLRILVVEDNEINRLVIDDILHREDANTFLVDSGPKAIAAVERERNGFHAVLMDLQMPQMDGIETTLHLLRISPALPIIGQTAHALKEEHERCLAAGMMAILSKPIDVELLINTLLKVIHRDDQDGETGAAPIEPALIATTEASNFVIDWPALTQRFANRQAFILRLIQSSIDVHANDPVLLRNHVRTNNLEQIEFMAHALKGFAGTLFAHEVNQLAVKTLNAARAAETEALILAEQLAAALERLLEALGEGPPTVRQA